MAFCKKWKCTSVFEEGFELHLRALPPVQEAKVIPFVAVKLADEHGPAVTKTLFIPQVELVV